MAVRTGRLPSGSSDICEETELFPCMPPAEGEEDDLENFLDGYSAQEVFSAGSRTGITFDDLIALPGAIDFNVMDVDLNTRLTRKINLKVPLVSSPMDTVTEAPMAVAMALQGGIGFLHNHNSIEEQVSMVRKVKRFENGFISEPAVMKPSNTVADLIDLRDAKGIKSVPVTDTGKMNGILVGVVTKTDVDFLKNRDTPVSEVMTPADKCVVAAQPCTLDDCNDLVRTSKKGLLPIVDSDNRLKALVSRSDLQKNRDYPNASKDFETKKLLVGAAVGVTEADRGRVTALVEAGVDVVLFDCKQGDCEAQLDIIRWTKATHPNLQLVGGNVVTQSQALHLLQAGVDALRVGMGVGSVSTSQEVKAVGRAQISSIYYVAKLAKKFDVPVIADGGIANPGCAIKALVAGASAVMMGSLLAGTEQSPGSYFFQDGMRLKHYRGTASIDALKTKRDAVPSQRSGVFAQGVSGAVVDKGSVARFVPYMTQAIRHGMQDMGRSSLASLWDGLYDGTLRFELRSVSAQREGGVHDLFSYQKRLHS